MTLPRLLEAADLLHALETANQKLPDQKRKEQAGQLAERNESPHTKDAPKKPAGGIERWLLFPGITFQWRAMKLNSLGFGLCFRVSRGSLNCIGAA